MYPVLIRHVSNLKEGDVLIAHSGVRYPRPLHVLGPARHGVRVEVQNPSPGDPAELILHEWETDGQVLEVDRPSWHGPRATARRR